jgi:hypothetical protein
MEPAASVPRQNGMMTKLRGALPAWVLCAGVLCVGVLCAALAGCGSVTASSAGAGAAGTAGARASSSAASAQASGAAGAQASGAAGAQAAPAVGCAGAGQATKVIIRRSMHLVEPVRAGTATVTQRDATLVRALFRQFCAAVSHPASTGTVMNCPASFGMSYTGTFYDGTRPLATFVYGASGCQSLSVTAGGKRQFTMLYGRAAAAAPQLQADMAAVLGVPKYAVSAPQTVSPGGPGRLPATGAAAGYPTRRGRTRRP